MRGKTSCLVTLCVCLAHSFFCLFVFLLLLLNPWVLSVYCGDMWKERECKNELSLNGQILDWGGEGGGGVSKHQMGPWS